MKGTLRLRHDQISKHCCYWIVFSTVIWSSKTFTIKAKLHLFMPIVVSTTAYASNTWKSTSKCIQQLDVLQQHCLGISWISSSKIELQTKMFFVYLEWFHEVNWWLIGRYINVSHYETAKYKTCNSNGSQMVKNDQ